MDKIFESKWFHLGTAALITILVVIIYSNTYTSTFHFDDRPNIIENYKLRDLSNLPYILKGQRGVTMATFAVNYAIGGHNVVGYHLVNTLIHIVNAILAYFLLYYTFGFLKCDELWSRKIAAFSALLFAVHPIQTQAVTYIVQRMESLASLFYLVAMLLFIAAVKAGKKEKRIALYAGVVLSYILGFKSKEIAVTLPVVIFLYDLYFINGGGIKGLLPRWPLYTVMGLLALYLTISAVVPLGGFGDLSDASSGVSSAVSVSSEEVSAQRAKPVPSAGFGIKGIGPKEYLYTQFNVITYYLTLLLVPVNQNLDYDFPVSDGLFSAPVVKEGTVLNFPIPPPIVSLSVLLILLALAVGFFIYFKNNGGHRRPLISFFLLWFFIIVMPTSSFVPIIDVIFEHRVYLASLGIFVIFAILFDMVMARLTGGASKAS